MFPQEIMADEEKLQRALAALGGLDMYTLNEPVRSSLTFTIVLDARIDRKTKSLVEMALSDAWKAKHNGKYIHHIYLFCQ